METSVNLSQVVISRFAKYNLCRFTPKPSQVRKINYIPGVIWKGELTATNKNRVVNAVSKPSMPEQHGSYYLWLRDGTHNMFGNYDRNCASLQSHNAGHQRNNIYCEKQSNLERRKMNFKFSVSDFFLYFFFFTFIFFGSKLNTLLMVQIYFFFSFAKCFIYLFPTTKCQRTTSCK